MPHDYLVENRLNPVNGFGFSRPSEAQNEGVLHANAAQPRAILSFKAQVDKYGQDTHVLLRAVAHSNSREGVSPSVEAPEVLVEKIKNNLESLRAQPVNFPVQAKIEENLKEDLKALATQLIDSLYGDSDSTKDKKMNTLNKYRQAQDLLNHMQRLDINEKQPLFGEEECAVYMALLEKLIPSAAKGISKFRALPFELAVQGANIDDIMQIFHFDTLPKDKAEKAREMLNYICVFSLKLKDLNNGVDSQQDIAAFVKKQGLTHYIEALSLLRESKWVKPTDKHWLSHILLKMNQRGEALTCRLNSVMNGNKGTFCVAICAIILFAMFSSVAAICFSGGLALAIMALFMTLMEIGSAGAGMAGAIAGIELFGSVVINTILIALGTWMTWGMARCSWWTLSDLSTEYSEDKENSVYKQLKKQGTPVKKTLNLQEIYQTDAHKVEGYHAHSACPLGHTTPPKEEKEVDPIPFFATI